MALEEWTISIPGPPVAKERPRRAPDGHWYTPPRTTRAEEHVGECLLAAGVRLEPEADYTLDITYYLSTRRADIDNLCKLTCDGIGTYGKPDGWNDRQVSSLVVRRVGVHDATEERTEVVIRRVT